MKGESMAMVKYSGGEIATERGLKKQQELKNLETTVKRKAAPVFFRQVILNW